MTKDIALKIISAVTGLALVGYGGWLLMQGQAEAGSAILTGGLGTLGLPALVGPKSVKEGE